jgi:hypothetical protein
MRGREGRIDGWEMFPEENLKEVSSTREDRRKRAPEGNNSIDKGRKI